MGELLSGNGAFILHNFFPMMLSYKIIWKCQEKEKEIDFLK